MRKTLWAIVATNMLTASLFLTMSTIQAHIKPENSKINRPKCTHMMMKSLGQADKNYDLRFINAMIPHHEGAIMMAKDAQQKAQHPEIKTMAQDIIDSQQKEIEQLKAWRKSWYGM